jgi:hypothetical protein
VRIAVKQAENGNFQSPLDHLQEKAGGHVGLSLARDDDAGELPVRRTVRTETTVQSMAGREKNYNGPYIYTWL